MIIQLEIDKDFAEELVRLRGFQAYNIFIRSLQQQVNAQGKETLSQHASSSKHPDDHRPLIQVPFRVWDQASNEEIDSLLDCLVPVKANPTPFVVKVLGFTPPTAPAAHQVA